MCRRWKYVSESWRPGRQATNASTISRCVYEERLAALEDEVSARADPAAQAVHDLYPYPNPAPRGATARFPIGATGALISPPPGPIPLARMGDRTAGAAPLVVRLQYLESEADNPAAACTAPFSPAAKAGQGGARLQRVRGDALGERSCGRSMDGAAPAAGLRLAKARPARMQRAV